MFAAIIQHARIHLHENWKRVKCIEERRRKKQRDPDEQAAPVVNVSVAKAQAKTKKLAVPPLAVLTLLQQTTMTEMMKQVNSPTYNDPADPRSDNGDDVQNERECELDTSASKKTVDD